MSRMEALAAEAARTDCRNCKRWHDWGDNMGRCMKYYGRIVITLSYDTCENFSERNEEKNGK